MTMITEKQQASQDEFEIFVAKILFKCSFISSVTKFLFFLYLTFAIIYSLYFFTSNSSSIGYYLFNIVFGLVAICLLIHISIETANKKKMTMDIARINKALDVIHASCNLTDSKYFQHYKNSYNNPDSILSVVHHKMKHGEEILEYEILDYVVEKITKFHNIRIS